MSKRKIRGPIKRLSKEDLLKKIPFFQNLPPPQLDFLREQMQELRLYSRSYYGVKKTVYMEGDQADKLYFILAGLIRISRLKENGDEMTIFLCHDGEFFGEDALVSTERTATAHVLRDCRLIAIPGESLALLLATNPLFSLFCTTKIMERSLALQNYLAIQSIMSTQERLLAFFESYENEFGINSLRDLSHAELAKLCHTTRETVNRAFNKLGIRRR